MYPRTNLLLIFFLGLTVFNAHAQNISARKKIDHSVYNSWNELKNNRISSNGNFIIAEKQKFRGDGSLQLYDVAKKQIYSYQRGYQAVFNYNSTFVAYKIKAPADTIRKLKLLKKKDEQLPKDSFIVRHLVTDSVYKFAAVKTYKLPEKGNCIAVYFEKQDENQKITKDSTQTKRKSKPKKSKSGQDTSLLTVFKPESGKRFDFKKVTDYESSDENDIFLILGSPSDSIDSCYISVFTGKSEQTYRVMSAPGYAKKPAVSTKGDQVAFLYSSDTSKTKNYSLFYWNNSFKNAFKLIDTATAGFPDNFVVSENFTPWFSEDGEKLFLGTAPGPLPEVKDTLLPEEKPKVDIWSWNDGLIQPEQLQNLDKEKKRSYLAVYQINKNKFLQVASPRLPNVSIKKKNLPELLLAHTDIPYRTLKTWDDTYSDYYIFNLETGKTDKVLSKINSTVVLSPDGKYLIYWNTNEKAWYSIDTKTFDHQNLCSKLKVVFENEDHDQPSAASPYGITGFGKSDEFVYVNDRFDIWALHTGNQIPPVCITDSMGRKQSIRYNYLITNPDQKWIDFSKPCLLTGFNEITKQDAYFGFNYKLAPSFTVLSSGPYHLSGLVKAKEDDNLVFLKENYNTSPDLYYTDVTFSEIIKITDINPQANDYQQGSVELVEWTNSQGVKLEGLLYKPEGFNSSEKYPMIVYFYEKNSKNLFSYHAPKPSRSVINIPYFVSNGYVVFVPDIVYQKGYPGKSAYDCIVSGTLAVVSKGFIDKERIGIQGQSWGGYQVAYLVTQTDLFACAMAGAPVSNMTSAYGGIRWESGVSRMFQYEKTQSRIGETLWEAPIKYIENSPLFYADKINTPLLIMSNDGDGAVPWYQGIELYSALRRLSKPVWLLNYNGDEHNLKAENYGNRLDLSIRMGQFFDHYLKKQPMPDWLQNGIPAVLKGIESGY